MHLLPATPPPTFPLPLMPGKTPFSLNSFSPQGRGRKVIFIIGRKSSKIHCFARSRRGRNQNTWFCFQGGRTEISRTFPSFLFFWLRNTLYNLFLWWTKCPIIQVYCTWFTMQALMRYSETLIKECKIKSCKSK